MIAYKAQPEDRTLLVRYIVTRRVLGFLLTVFLQSLASFYIGGFAASIWFLQSISPFWLSIGWIVFCALIHIALIFRIIHRSLDWLAHARCVTINSEGLTVKYAIGYYGNKADEDRPLRPGTTLKNTGDGIYIYRNGAYLMIPHHAFEGELEAAKFAAAFNHSKGTKGSAHIPDGNINGFSWPVTFQQSKRDIVHAYYHGWARSFLKTQDARIGKRIVAALIAISAISAYNREGQSDIVSVLVTALSAAIAIIVVVFFASPAFPLGIAERRRHLAQPLTLALGTQGIAINNGTSTQVLTWAMIAIITGDRRCLYIDMRDDLLVIPRSAFLEDIAEERFLNAALSYLHGIEPFPKKEAIAWPPAPEPLCP